MQVKNILRNTLTSAILSVIALTFAGTNAKADIVTYNSTFSGISVNVGATVHAATLSTFNDSLGTLTEAVSTVSLDLSSSKISLVLTPGNEEQIAHIPVDFALQVKVNLTIGTTTLSQTITLNPVVGTLESYNSFTHEAVFELASAAASTSFTITNTALLELLSEPSTTPTVSLNVLSLTSENVWVESQCAEGCLQLDGTASIAYTYTPEPLGIPEPGTWAMLVGGLGVVLLAQRRVPWRMA